MDLKRGAELATIFGVLPGVIAVLTFFGIKGCSHDSTTASAPQQIPASSGAPPVSYPPAQTGVPQPESPSYRTSTYIPSPTEAPPVGPSEAPAPPPATDTISSVFVTPRTGNGLLQKVGSNTFELQPTIPSSINPPYMTFDWSSQGANGEIASSDCTVEADISGPGDYPQHRRSGACSGSPSQELKIMQSGTYTISVAVTPPGGGLTVTGTASFSVVPRGG